MKLKIKRSFKNKNYVLNETIISPSEISFYLYEPKYLFYEIKVNVGDLVLVGQVIAIKKNKNYTINVLSSVSGRVIFVDTLRTNPIIKIINDQEFMEYTTITPSFLPKTKDELVNIIQNFGIIGLGGGGFPTSIKINRSNVIKKLVINCVECEPYLISDKFLFTKELTKIFACFVLLKQILNIEKVIIAIKKTSSDLIKSIKTYLDNNLSYKDFICLYITKDFYPAGYEINLVNKISKLKLLTTDIPVDHDHLVINLSTAYAIYLATYEKKPLNYRYVLVSDMNKRQELYKVIIGTTYFELLKEFDLTNKLIISGGPMMGNRIDNLNHTTTILTSAVFVTKKIKSEENVCIKCATCIKNCPVKISPYHINKHAKYQNIKALEKENAYLCCGCGICSYVCPSSIDLTHNISLVKRRKVKTR